MSTKNDGGPAFPVTHAEDGNGAVRQWGETGMTLRDWFAGQALAAIFGHEGLMTEAAAKYSDRGARDAVAQAAYDIADSMLKARGEA